MLPSVEDGGRLGVTLYLSEFDDYPTRRMTLNDITGNDRCTYNNDNNLFPHIYTTGFNGLHDEKLNGVKQSFFGWVCLHFYPCNSLVC